LLKAPNSFGPVRPLVTVADDGSRWRVPVCAMAVMPRKRMGPPLRSFAADAHCCIMVGFLHPPNTRLWRDWSRPKAGSPLIVIPTAPSVPPCSKLSRCGLVKAEHAARWCDGQPWQLLRAPTYANRGSGRRNGLSDRTKKLTKD